MTPLETILLTGLAISFLAHIVQAHNVIEIKAELEEADKALASIMHMAGNHGTRITDLELKGKPLVRDE